MLKKLIIVVVAGFAIAAISTFFRLPPVWMSVLTGAIVIIVLWVLFYMDRQ
jgi:hypothetical protein